MIASLKGELAEIQIMPDVTAQITVDVQGVGYKVTVLKNSLDLIGKIGDTVSLKIYSYIRESVISLYGFSSGQERSFFESLLLANGVGPSLAMTVLSSGEMGDLISAIVNSDIDVLTKVPGIGKKTDQRLVIELSERLGKMENLTAIYTTKTSQIAALATGDHNYGTYSKEIALIGEALKSLGYGNDEIRNALFPLSQLSREELDASTPEDMLKMALRSLARR